MLVVFIGVSLKFGNRRYLANIRADSAMEIIIALATVVMAFRFKRLVLFSALSLVPLFAALLQSIKAELESSRAQGLTSVPHSGLPISNKPGDNSVQRASLLSSVGAVVCVSVMAFLFWRAAIVPYLPSNPFCTERPVARELMSFDSYSQSLVSFIRMNGIGETNFERRFLVGWELSPYLMQAMPQIRVFMDCRDQSVYPDRIATDYFTIMGVIRADSSDPLALLDQYGVTSIALTTNPIDLQAAIRFMQSRKWACIYADPDALLLVRADSDRFQEAVKTGLKGLRFPSEESRSLSRAFLYHFMHGYVPQDIVEDLEVVAKSNPWPNLYTLIVLGLEKSGSCFRQETVTYLLSEAARLSGVDPTKEKRGAQVLESLVRIYEILRMNALECGNIEADLGFDRLREDAQRNTIS